MISVPTIISAGSKRFIPGVVSFFLSALVLSASFKEMTIGPTQIASVTQLTLSLFAGYVAGLVIARKRMARGARIDGPRSNLAGFAATRVLLGLGVLHGSPVSRALNCLFAVGAGIATTALLFAPWLTSGARPSARADDLDIIEGAESVLADRPSASAKRRTTQPTKTPRQISPIRAD